MQMFADPAEHNVRANILCICTSLKPETHRKGVDKLHGPPPPPPPNVSLISPSNPRFFSARKSMGSLKSRHAVTSVSRAISFLLWEWQRFRLLPSCCRHHWEGDAPLSRYKLVLLAGDGKRNIATKLPSALASDEAPPPPPSSPSRLPRCTCHCAGCLLESQVENWNWPTAPQACCTCTRTLQRSPRTLSRPHQQELLATSGHNARATLSACISKYMFVFSLNPFKTYARWR